MRVFRYAFIFFCLFPWLSFNIISFETQPWVIIFASFLIVINLRSLKFSDFSIIAAPFFILFFLPVYGDEYGLFFRSFFSYFIFSLVFVCLRILIHRNQLEVGFFKFCNAIWIFVAVVQFYFGNSIVDFFLVTRTSDDRGVTSFAPEPTFFAIFLFFMNWFYLIVEDYKLNKNNIVIILCNFFSILFLAKSSLVFLMMAFSLIFLFFVNYKGFIRKIFFIIILLGVFAGAFWMLSNFSGDSRIVRVVNIFIENPINLFFDDASANERLKNIAYPFLGIFENYGFPGGFDSFQKMHDYLKITGPDFFWYGDGDNKILSLTGSVVYELGVVGVLVLLIIFFKAYSKSRKAFFEVTALLFVCFNAISIAFPMVAIILSMILYRKEKHNVQE